MYSIVVDASIVKKKKQTGYISFLIESYNRSVKMWKKACKICGQPYTRCGGYMRRTPRQFGGFRIQRVWCKSCGISHALIPYFVLPYGRYLVSEVEFVLSFGCCNLTIEQLAELILTEPSTILRWRYRFKTSAGKNIIRLAGMLANTPLVASSWLQSRGPPEQKVFELLSVLRRHFFETFAFPDLALLNLLNSGQF